MPSGLKSVKVNGSLAYEQFNLLYTFTWVNGLLIQFNVKPDSTAHIVEDDPVVMKEEIAIKTKKFLLSIIRMNKLEEAK